ncbi:hypothetical protein SAMN02910298_00416 [Pseudobutyrivibrio sp. YE44]|uniref:DUF6056 family protein n=1 Tax=Pseudobutyrivibrio sp. YE44 TaxID=1520802 RepID=UPI0008845D0D|nr:DUF6056 family protein [Pseudobutyrivibrio sp. YE44]SDB09415.1 hypothetical protein SAMN02910298_00416 [Pseudobutyrivibrio sp. YE44]
MSEKTIRNILIGLFILSIIPILSLCIYIKPLWDDYSSAATVRILIPNVNSIVALIINPLITPLYQWFAWQGTYSAEFVFALQPGAWPIPAYWITPFVIIGSISIAYIVFGSTVSKYIFKCSSLYGIAIAIVTLIITFQYTPYIHQAFYWFNGATYYGLFYALMIFELSLIIKVLYSDKDYSKKQRILLYLFTFIISGGNYSTAFVNLLVLLLIIFDLYVTKEKTTNKVIIKMTIFAFIGLVISMIAPGNAVRASSTTSMSAFRAIFTSIKQAIKFVLEWTNLPQIGLYIILIPILAMLIKNLKNISMIRMLIWIVVLCGLYAAQITPPLYAMSSPGDKRQINLYYYSYYFIFICVLACILLLIKSKFPQINEAIIKSKLILISLGAIVLITGIFINGYQNLNSFQTYKEISSGNAKTYYEEYTEIIEQVKSSEGECYVSDIEHSSDILPKFELSDDPDNWVNQSIADYYGIEKVHLKE